MNVRRSRYIDNVDIVDDSEVASSLLVVPSKSRTVMVARRRRYGVWIGANPFGCRRGW